MYDFATNAYCARHLFIVHDYCVRHLFIMWFGKQPCGMGSSTIHIMKCSSANRSQ